MSEEKFRILLIEDNPGDARLIQELLRYAKGACFEIENAETLEDGLACLSGDGIDVVLLDLGLPDAQGFGTFSQAHERAQSVPIIVLTGLDDETLAIKAVKQGAQDYLVKGRFDSDVLSRSIRYAIERKRAEEALRESEERYRDLFENATDLIQCVAADGRFLYVNRAWMETLGYSEADIDSITLMDVIHPDSMQHCMEVLGQVFEGKTVKGVEAKFVGKDGREIVVEGNASCRFENGVPISTRGIFRDITERKKAEEELKRTNAELKGFAHTVSHDIRNPLATIMLASGTIHELLEASLTEESRAQLDEVAQLIGQNVEKTTALIEDILALAEAGQVPEEVEDVDIKGVVEAVISEHRAEIESKGIEVRVDDDLGRVRASNTHMYQLFSNLFTNAIKHGDSESPVISIGCLGSDGGRGMHYVVRDNGSGIPPENLEQIFLPFFKGKTGGTGIGLATVEKIVKIYGGEIKAYNDNGACFEFVVRDFADDLTPG